MSVRHNKVWMQRTSQCTLGNATAHYTTYWDQLLDNRPSYWARAAVLQKRKSVADGVSTKGGCDVNHMRIFYTTHQLIANRKTDTDQKQTSKQNLSNVQTLVPCWCLPDDENVHVLNELLVVCEVGRTIVHVRFQTRLKCVAHEKQVWIHC